MCVFKKTIVSFRRRLVDDDEKTRALTEYTMINANNGSKNSKKKKKKKIGKFVLTMMTRCLLIDDSVESRHARKFGVVACFHRSKKRERLTNSPTLNRHTMMSERTRRTFTRRTTSSTATKPLHLSFSFSCCRCSCCRLFCYSPRTPTIRRERAFNRLAR